MRYKKREKGMAKKDRMTTERREKVRQEEWKIEIEDGGRAKERREKKKRQGKDRGWKKGKKEEEK